MRKLSIGILTVLLLVSLAGVILILVDKTGVPTAEELRKVHPAPALDGASRTLEKPKVEVKAVVPSDASGTTALTKSQPKPEAERLVLPSEIVFLADNGKMKGLDARSSINAMKGNEFGKFMDQLESEATGSSLASDITHLYTQSANETNAIVDNSVTTRIVCGMNICALSATAPSKEVFDAWNTAFLHNSSATPYSSGRYDKVLKNGAVEYRIIFTTDPERNASIMRR